MSDCQLLGHITIKVQLLYCILEEYKNKFDMFKQRIRSTQKNFQIIGLMETIVFKDETIESIL